MAISGPALAGVAAGSLFLYAGITGKNIPKALQAIIRGQSPQTAPQSNPITGSTDTGITGTGGSGPAVAGSGYVGPRKAYLALRVAGFSQSAAIMMTAIGGVESGWSTTALNNDPATGDLSVGVWQINYFGSLATERTQLFGTWQDLLNGGLQKQASAAFTLYQQSGGFGPWQPDITSGKILRFWAQATAAAGG